MNDVAYISNRFIVGRRYRDVRDDGKCELRSGVESTSFWMREKVLGLSLRSHSRTDKVASLQCGDEDAETDMPRGTGYKDKVLRVADHVGIVTSISVKTQ